MGSNANLAVSELITHVLNEMNQFHYSSETIKLFKRIYNRLEKLAESMGKAEFDEELAQAFLNDSTYARTGKYCHSRFLLHRRCVYFLKSFVVQGVVDWATQYNSKRPQLKVDGFVEALELFIGVIKEKQLKKNTIDGYERIVFYFLRYCEDKRHRSLKDVTGLDITAFLEKLCQEHYQPTSLISSLSGLKLFLSLNGDTELLLNSIPCRLPRKRGIISVLEEDEYERFAEYLRSGNLSNRDTAICWIALETGLRAVDICNLKLNDVDWKNDCIHILQQKTSKSLEIPLRSTYGNALAAYILHDRPESDSPYLFLQTSAPFFRLASHAGYYNILYNAFRGAGILKPGRICGTRFTRHNAASHMLRRGIPLSEISAALGHSDPNSVNTYLTTDAGMLTECTLPLPLLHGKGVGYSE